MPHINHQLTPAERRALYVRLCEQKDKINIFSQYWWLDILCGAEGWDVSIAFHKNGEIAGALPYTYQSKMGFKMIIHPPLTPFLDVYLDLPVNSSHYKMNSAYHKIMNTLIDGLPRVPFFSQIYTPNVQNWLPFYWKGYQQTTYYSQFVDTRGQSPEALLQQFNRHIRRSIRKAREELTLAPVPALPVLHELLTKSNIHQKVPSMISLEKFVRLEAALVERQARNIYYATDRRAGTPCSFVYTINDGDTCYSLFSGNDLKAGQNNDAYKLLTYEAMCHAAREEKLFDFCGSVLSNVAPINLRFNAQIKPLSKIYKLKNKFWKVLYQAIK